MIVDCHTHWGLAWEATSPGDLRPWLAVLDRHGIDRAWLMGEEGLTDPGACRRDNDRLAAFARAWPERVEPLGSCWPHRDASIGLDEARRCVEDLGMRALKFHPWIQALNLSALDGVCEFAAARRTPIIFHDGTPPQSLSEQVAGLALRHPETTFVLGHSGLLWAWREALAAAELPNVWLCLCGPHRRAIKCIARRADPNRLLWGTDSGFGLMDMAGYRLALVRDADLPPGLLAKILDENPRRLLGI